MIPLIPLVPRLVILGLFVGGLVLVLRQVRQKPPEHGSWFLVLLLLWLVLMPWLWLFSPAPSFLVLLLLLIIPPLLGVVLIFLRLPAIFPMDPEQSSNPWKIWQFLAGFIFGRPKPAWVVVDGEIQERIKGDAFWGLGPGLALTEAHNVIVFGDGSQIKAIEGPGFVFTEKAQLATATVDLREQLRGQTIEAVSRDGIRLLVPFSCIFRIDPGQQVPRLGEYWPYHKRAVFLAFRARQVDPAGKTPLDAPQAVPWENLPGLTAQQFTRQEIARYRLDDLYAVTTPGQFLRPTIGQQIRTLVAAQMEPNGIKMTGGSIGNSIRPKDDEVVKQRVEAWKARWIQKMMVMGGQAEAERLRLLERARAKIRLEALLQLAEPLADLQKNGDLAPNVIALRLLDTLEEMARRPQVESLLPASSLALLTDLRQQVGGTGPGGAR